MVLAFYLDPFYTPCRQQIGVDLWGGEHLPTICGRAVHILCDDDAALEDINLRKLGSFLRRTNVRTSAMSGRLLHPATWWELYGTQWPTLHFLAGRLFSLLTSSAGSKRMFKALSVVLSRTRSRTLDDKVEKQWCIAVNDKQFQRGDIIGEYARFSVEQLLIRLVDVGGLDGALGGLIVAPAGAPGAAHPLLAGVVPAPPDSAAPAPPADADPPPRPRKVVVEVLAASWSCPSGVRMDAMRTLRMLTLPNWLPWAARGHPEAHRLTWLLPLARLWQWTPLATGWQTATETATTTPPSRQRTSMPSLRGFLSPSVRSSCDRGPFAGGGVWGCRCGRGGVAAWRWGG